MLFKAKQWKQLRKNRKTEKQLRTCAPPLRFKFRRRLAQIEDALATFLEKDKGETKRDLRQVLKVRSWAADLLQKSLNDRNLCSLESAAADIIEKKQSFTGTLDKVRLEKKKQDELKEAFESDAERYEIQIKSLRKAVKRLELQNINENQLDKEKHRIRKANHDAHVFQVENGLQLEKQKMAIDVLATRSHFEREKLAYREKLKTIHRFQEEIKSSAERTHKSELELEELKADHASIRQLEEKTREGLKNLKTRMDEIKQESENEKILLQQENLLISLAREHYEFNLCRKILRAYRKHRKCKKKKKKKKKGCSTRKFCQSS